MLCFHFSDSNEAEHLIHLLESVQCFSYLIHCIVYAGLLNQRIYGFNIIWLNL